MSSGATQSATSGTDLTITLGTLRRSRSSRSPIACSSRAAFATTATARSVSHSRVSSIQVSVCRGCMSDESFFPHAELAELVPCSARRTARRACSRARRPRRASSRRRRRRSAGADQPGVRIGALGNAKLKPEYSGEFETGFDATLFSSRTTSRVHVLQQEDEGRDHLAPDRAVDLRSHDRSSTTSVRSGTRAWKPRSTTGSSTTTSSASTSSSPARRTRTASFRWARA